MRMVHHRATIEEGFIKSGGGTGPSKPRQPTDATSARCQIRAGASCEIRDTPSGDPRSDQVVRVRTLGTDPRRTPGYRRPNLTDRKIGRASCRERVEMSG